MAVQSRFLKRFVEAEQTAGMLLLIATIAALFWANSTWHESYLSFWETHIALSFGDSIGAMSLRHIVDDVLMALFFLLVGCELKRERVEGELSSPSQIKLPLFAALGGMIVPALLFLGVNLFLPDTGRSYINGWAIPTATDIAFALGVLVMMKSYAPPSLKAFLLALAIIDDLGAVLLIGLFYSSGLNFMALAAAGIISLFLWGLNKRGVNALVPYMFLGALLWFAIFKSGIHATLAGVILALFLPLKTAEGPSPLKVVESKLHVWVAYAILPIFALASAGVPLQGVSLDMFLSPLTLGIIAGLFFGKQIGVFGATWFCIKMGLAKKPARAGWLHIYGLSLLCGIGFTMSLFISALAFADMQAMMSARLGILTASTLSALTGCAVLALAGKRAHAEDLEAVTARA